MKSLLLVGGLLGWGVGMGASYLKGNGWPACFWHGCLAAYVTAWLVRWWGRAWRTNLQQSLLEREKAEQAMPPSSPITTPKPSRT
jgi:hypothetical protein